MSERLELYKEIIELDPQSRVFFKYAQLLEKEQRVDEALSALARGLEFQPDFMEARLYYIDLLTRNDRLESASIQLHKFTSLFKKYPAFWLTWSKLTMEENSTVGSTLALLSALFNNPSLSVMQIFQAGLQSYTDQISTAKMPTNAQNPIAQDLRTNKAETEHPLSVSDTITAILASNDSLSSLSSMDIFDSKDASFDTDFLQEDFNEEVSIKSSVHTRSMADLLAEQGDIQGAIAIYSELLEKASGHEKEEVAKRLNSLRNHFEVAEHANTSSNQPTKNSEKNQSEKKLAPRMQSMLERLADRLEDRALRTN